MMLPDFFNENWMYLAGAALLSVIGSYFSRKFFIYLKRAVIVAVVLFSLAAGFKMITGRSIVQLPGDIDRKLSEEPENPETGHRYYKSYEERFSEKVPRD